MAHRRRVQEAPVSLFPMFNVLVATLGVLVFIQITVVVMSLGIGKSIIFVPKFGNGPKPERNPVYIEWTGQSLILYPAQTTFRIGQDISKIETWDETYKYLDKLLGGTELEQLFNEVRRKDSSTYLIIVIRPSGFANFFDLRGYFEARNIPIGYEPIDESYTFRGR